MEHFILKIALDTPLDTTFDYRWTPIALGQSEAQINPAQINGQKPQIGQLALVPFGRQELMGLIVGISQYTDVPAAKLKDVIEVRHQMLPLNQQWLALCEFAADYYQRPLGEVAVPALPRNLRAGKATSLERNLKKLAKLHPALDASPSPEPALNTAQQTAVDAIAGAQGFAPHLLYGVTGSGKTEVYLQAAARILAQSSDAQV